MARKPKSTPASQETPHSPRKRKDTLPTSGYPEVHPLAPDLPGGGVEIQPAFSPGEGVTEEEQERSGVEDNRDRATPGGDREERAQENRTQADCQDTIRTSWPRRSPASDPTCPVRQEASLHAAAERANERRIDEPGLTDEDREGRNP
jgi:hypothetical protein